MKNSIVFCLAVFLGLFNESLANLNDFSFAGDTIISDKIFSSMLSPELNKDELVNTEFHSNINNSNSQYTIYKTKNGLKDYLIKGSFSKIFFKQDSSEDKSISFFSIFPFKDVNIGWSNATKKIPHENAVGIVCSGLLRNKFSWFVNYKYSDLVVPKYMDSIIKKTNVIPGLAYANRLGVNHYFYNFLMCGIKYSPNKIFSFQLGNGKNFFGDGYRSLLLSDNSSAYPNFLISTKVWHINYISIFANFKDIRGSDGIRNRFVNKYASIHYLSWDISKKFNLSIFEAIVFQNRSQSGRPYFFEPNYLNPIIFFRPVEYSVGSPDNSLLGLNLRYKFPEKTSIYGQLILDEFLLKEIKARKGWLENKQGFQIGIKSWDVFGLKNLKLLAEINYVRPYTYYHKNVLQNYANYNQPLAHPMGANFKEVLGKLDYSVSKRISIASTLIFCTVGLDYQDSIKGVLSYGQDLYQPFYKRPNEYGNFVGQGMSTNLMILDLQGYYLLSEESNLYINLGAMYRNQINTLAKNNELIFNFGMRTILGRKEKYY